MTERKCKSCGAPLRDIGFGKYICDYCGALFEDHYNDIRFMLTNYSLSELSRSLADGLKGFMKVIVSEDPSRMATIVRGEVRVIPPDHRF